MHLYIGIMIYGRCLEKDCTVAFQKPQNTVMSEYSEQKEKICGRIKMYLAAVQLSNSKIFSLAYLCTELLLRHIQHSLQSTPSIDRVGDISPPPVVCLQISQSLENLEVITSIQHPTEVFSVPLS